MLKHFFLIVVMAFVFAANSAEILLQHFDPFENDYYPEPELGGEVIRCDYWIKKSLEANGYTFTYNYGEILPSSIDNYDVILITLGYWYC